MKENQAAETDQAKEVASRIRPQDALLQSSFLEVVARHSRKKIGLLEDGTPAINRQLPIWSTDQYPAARTQYFIGHESEKSFKNYHVKFVANNGDLLFKSYSPAFRNKVRIALRNGFSTEVVEGRKVQQREALFETHREAMLRLGSFNLPRHFVLDLFDIEGEEVKVYIVNCNREVAAFCLMIGPVLYLMAARPKYFSHKINNYLLHQIYKDHPGRTLYLGTAFKDGGLDKFKAASGTRAIPCAVLPRKRNVIYGVASCFNHLNHYLPMRPFYNAALSYSPNLLLVLPYG